MKSRILADPVASSSEVSVETIRGQVYLRGIVHTADDKTRVQNLAKEVPGAYIIVNKLEVQEI